MVSCSMQFHWIVQQDIETIARMLVAIKIDCRVNGSLLQEYSK